MLDTLIIRNQTVLGSPSYGALLNWDHNNQRWEEFSFDVDNPHLNLPKGLYIGEVTNRICIGGYLRSLSFVGSYPAIGKYGYGGMRYATGHTDIEASNIVTGTSHNANGDMFINLLYNVEDKFLVAYAKYESGQPSNLDAAVTLGDLVSWNNSTGKWEQATNLATIPQGIYVYEEGSASYHFGAILLKGWCPSDISSYILSLVTTSYTLCFRDDTNPEKIIAGTNDTDFQVGYYVKDHGFFMRFDKY